MSFVNYIRSRKAFLWHKILYRLILLIAYGWPYCYKSLPWAFFYILFCLLLFPLFFINVDVSSHIHTYGSNKLYLTSNCFWLFVWLFQFYLNLFLIIWHLKVHQIVNLALICHGYRGVYCARLCWAIVPLPTIKVMKCFDFFF